MFSSITLTQALLPLLARQLEGGGLPVKFLAATFALLSGLGPAMWHMCASEIKS